MSKIYNLNHLIEQFESGAILNYRFFWGHTNKNNQQVGNACFSQWYPSPFVIEGVTYKTAEHWMMAQKAQLFEDWRSFEKIIASETPKEAKNIGRTVLGYDDMIWNKERFGIVKQGNIHKFNQNPALADFLLGTKDEVLVEASPVDNIWGIGLAQDNPDHTNIYAWQGLNLLGFALIEVRDFLRAFGTFRQIDLALEPPWIKFPNVEPSGMFWNMGLGEGYITDFGQLYSKLTEREKAVYELCHPTPFAWREAWS